MLHQVNNENSGQRLDKRLVDLLEKESRATIQKLIKQECVLVNGKVEKANYKLRPNDTIKIVDPKQDESDSQTMTIEAEKMDLNIVYEDEDLVIINKPAGIVVHPSKGHHSGTLVNGLLYYLGHQLSSEGEAFRPGIVHRIDKDTSGLLVVAKNNYAHQKLSEQLSDHTMGRTYVALVNGQIEAPIGTIEVPLLRDPNNRLKWQANLNGKYALTEFEVITTYHDATLVQLHLKTGRTHQIRVHMEYIGHPIVGDPVYRQGLSQMKGVLPKINDGQLLHAQSIHFNHPTTGEWLEFSCALPEKFDTVLKTLEEDQ